MPPRPPAAPRPANVSGAHIDGSSQSEPLPGVLTQLLATPLAPPSALSASPMEQPPCKPSLPVPPSALLVPRTPAAPSSLDTLPDADASLLIPLFRPVPTQLDTDVCS